MNAVVDLSHWGTKDCEAYRQEIMDKHYRLAGPLSFDYKYIAVNHGYVKANLRLKELDNRLHLGGKSSGLLLSAGEDEIVSWADAKATRSKQLVDGINDMYQALDVLRPFVESVGLEYPLPAKLADDPRMQILSSIERVRCKRWWRRRVRVAQARAIEAVARDIRLVNQKKQIYCSNYSVSRYEANKLRNDAMLSRMEAENDKGQVYTLADLADVGVSNPVNRRNELMTRIAGFEEVAKLQGHVAVFYTLTAPSRCHAVLSNGRQNPKYDGSTPRDAQEHLCTVWARFRAWANRNDLRFYGFRVAEPHHDGTPHWHFLLFMKKRQWGQITRHLRRFAIAGTQPSDMLELGAKKYRFTSVRIDPAKGSAAGYIAKYIAKNIDGFGVNEGDLYGHDAVSSANRITAWASTWGIRQFQQIGGPSVTVWRFLRALDLEELDEWDAPLFDGQARDIKKLELERIHEAADSADWAAFVLLMGGPMVARADMALRPWTKAHFDHNGETVVFDTVTGEVLTPFQTSAYGELVKTAVGLVGLDVEASLQHFKTRFREWIVRPVRDALSGAQAPPWSSVNNCTEHIDAVELDYLRGAGESAP